MWSVWYRPNPGSPRIAARTSSLAGFALRSTANSRGPSVMWRLYNRALPSFRLHKRGLDHLALDRATANVDGDALAVLDAGGGGGDQRQRDADFQCRRKGSRCRHPDRGGAVEHGEVGPQHPAPDGAQAAQQAPRAGFLLGQQCIAAPERVLAPSDGPAAAGL